MKYCKSPGSHFTREHQVGRQCVCHTLEIIWVRRNVWMLECGVACGIPMPHFESTNKMYLHLKVFANTKHVILFINFIIYCSSCKTLPHASASDHLWSLTGCIWFSHFAFFFSLSLTTKFVHLLLCFVHVEHLTIPLSVQLPLIACISHPISVSFALFFTRCALFF